MKKPSDEITHLKSILGAANHIVIIQADNPDADSLASALALEAILSDQGKRVSLYCGVDMPSYLHYLPGWGRVSNELPKQFDASVIVDTASEGLLEQLNKQGAKSWVAAKPTVVLDHHTTEPNIAYADLIYNPPAVATGEIIYELAQKLSWTLDDEAMNLIAIAILSDSLGLMSAATTARSIHIIAELVERGVRLPELENARRESQRREAELIHYKGVLLQRVEFHEDQRVATLSVPWEEIERYSPLYNPPMLVIDDMRLARNTDVAICFKLYKDGKITAKIRANYGYPVADKLAEHFGGGGHPLASGFKITDGRSFDKLKQETIMLAAELIKEVEAKNAAETA